MDFPQNAERIKKYLLLAIGSLAVILLLLFPYRVPVSYFLVKQCGWEKIATAINPHDAGLFLEIGNGHFGGKRVYDEKRAQAAFLMAVKLKSNFPEAHYQLGRTYFIDGRFYQALFEINETLRLAPDFKKAYYMYGLINGYKGDLDQAVWGFEEFIRRDDFNWAGYNDLAWIYFKKGDFQKMREVAATGLQHARNNPWLSNIYGTALLNLGEKEGAREAFRVALEETEKLTPEKWGVAYPGNNPAIYEQGLEEMKMTIKHNIALAEG